MLVAHITDLHLDDVLSRWHGIDSRARVLAILKDMGERGIGTAAITGDCGAASSLPWLREALEGLGIEALFALGNHDSAAELEEAGLIGPSPGGERYSSKRLDGVECLFLDSSRGGIDAAQLEWLRGSLGAGEGAAYLFSHYPVFDCDSPVDLAFPLRRREEVQDLLLGSGRQVKLLCGHYHFRHEQAIGRIEQLVAPAAIMQVRARGPSIETESFDFGYRIVDLGLGTSEVAMFEGSGGTRERRP